MKNSKIRTISRRKFMGTSATMVAGVSLVGPSLFGATSKLEIYKKPNSLINGVQIGAITYSFRSMPNQSAEATLKYVVDSGISAIELMGDPAETFAGRVKNPVDWRAYYTVREARKKGTISGDQEKELDAMEAKRTAYKKEVASWRARVSMDKFEQLGKMYLDAGVSIYAFKPSAFGKDNTDAEIDWGLRAAKAMGASHVTLEHPGDDAWTQKLGDMGEKHGIYVAYHGHLQQTPTLWDTALKQSKYNAVNLDLGHFVAAGNAAPLEFIIAKHDRIKSMHVKDRQNKVHGQKNLPWGQGDTPIAQALQLIRDNNYKFPASIELEYEIPEGSNAIQEVTKCLDYCKTALT
ncbi:sugar phosphate isomerase/epimerase [Flavobacteriaceae bacterium F89]|uniref:Sugar phosphate isomerase/epimerase n=1 Tax=Cerina litoralis TaxID=2874477 RepID=A0AAE3JN17_9FLAO|nr:TIM barrel protein [Cerina litoralis]MCG2460485.1 sugar phosphate isomerase/epimerase [Cerina litoralis]